MLVRTRPVTRRPTGGVDIEEVVDWFVLERKANEEFFSECSLNGKSFVLSVVNRKKKFLIGVAVDDRGFEQMPLNYSAFPCDIP
jgi:hypothetical protein